MSSSPGRPKPVFTIFNAVAVVVGIVVGIGIFRLPPIVAQNATGGLQFILFWVAGGAISILGALCYAELASSHPDAGGEYHFLDRAFGRPVGFLFSWGRMTVIQTGSIALAAFILGDYATLIFDLGPYSSAIYAGLTVVGLTGLNVWGTRPSKLAQNAVTGTIVLILVSASLYSLIAEPVLAPTSPAGSQGSSGGAMGAAMIFVLLTYGGWNEAAYLSAEVKNVRKNMVKVLVFGIGLITAIYVLVNYAYLLILGLDGLKQSDTVGAAFIKNLLGAEGSIILSVTVIIAALSTANATVITGARTNYALGRDFSLLGFLGQWDQRHNTPVNALLVQGGIALLLVLLGAVTKESVQTMVDYTAPVFWFFLLLTTLSLFVFRYREDPVERPFSVPLYPVVPILFALASGYMLYSSLMFTGIGALLGVGILFVGVPVLMLARRHEAR